MATLRDVSLLRLAAQRLAGERHPTVAAAVRTMTALQGQDLPGVLCSAALRTDGGSLTGVRAAMDAGEVVRSWPMRGTLHLVAAEDLGWMIAIGAPRVATSAARRQGELGLDNATIVPHLGTATVETRVAMGMAAAANLLAALEGRRPPNLLNPEVLR